MGDKNGNKEIALYECALEVEKDKALSKEMEEWNVTLNDVEHDIKE